MTMDRFALFFAGSVALLWLLQLAHEKVSSLRSRRTRSSDETHSRVSGAQ